jgi:hypothetical protein
MDHVFISKFDASDLEASMTDTPGCAGSLDRYDISCTLLSRDNTNEHDTAVPIIFSGLFGIG